MKENATGRYRVRLPASGALKGAGFTRRAVRLGEDVEARPCSTCLMLRLALWEIDAEKRELVLFPVRQKLPESPVPPTSGASRTSM